MKTFIFGHKNPDTDSVASAVAYSHLKNALGEETKPVILGSINKETAFVFDHTAFEVPQIIENIEVNQRVILVDHNEFQQSVNGIEHGEILEVIDHHRIANFQTENPIYMRIEPIGCTGTILAKMYNEKNVDIPKDIALLLLSAIISDTLLFKSPTCTKEDKEIALKLAYLADVNVYEYGTALLKAGANLQGKNVKELLGIDAKEFDFDGKAIAASLNVVGFEEVLGLKEKIQEEMDTSLKEQELSFYFLLVTDVLEGESIGFISDGTNKNIAAHFGGINEENYLSLPDIVSRKKQLVPKLNKLFGK